MVEMRRVLVVENDENTSSVLALLLKVGGYDVAVAHRAEDAVRALEQQAFDAVLTDLRLDSRPLEQCWNVIDRLVAFAHPAPVGLMTGWPVKSAEAKRHNLAFVLEKPFGRAGLFDSLASAQKLPALDDELMMRIRSYFGVLEEGQYEWFHNLCTEDVVYRLPGDDPRFSNEVHGLAELITFTQRTFEAFPHPQFSINAIRRLPAGALVEYVATWREREQTREMPGAVMFEFRDRHFCRINVRVASEQLR